uniref:Bestrophin homolog n=1 Tax=Acrobeloides nanus TaxID=290746 RepID=A0A914C9B8_9BILA
MTISYEEEFSSLMLRWRGSLWKAVLKDLIAFYIAYYIILFAQWYLLDEQQKTYFTGWINWCEIGTQYIPLSFLLGFFVAVVVARWWEQFNWISWPDKMMMMIAACLPGPENLVVRKTIARWSSLQAAIAWSGISVRTLKRFPTERHLVESKLMTEEEYDMYTNTNAPHGKWFIPIIWIVNLVKQMYKQKKIDTIQMDMILKHVYSYRDGFAMLFVYDWVKIPLVYTQVVAIATYGYFLICLVARQPKLDEASMQKEICILFPIFTTFQLLFYLGWLKVGQFLMNPFGEDDDDFELNYVLDRNTCIANMMASELADQLPTYLSVELNDQLPHTRASFKIQDIIPKSSLQSFKLSPVEMQLILPHELKDADTKEKDDRKTSRVGKFIRSMDKRSRQSTIDEESKLTHSNDTTEV